MFDRALLWRATDFWREGLKSEWKKRITQYHERKLDKDSFAYQSIDEARTAERMSAEFLTDVSHWWWFVKEDGYLVTMSRGKNGKWAMHTRGGKQLTPPPGFLEGLERSMQHPPVMVGELVTSFTGCDADDRADAGRRNVLRNEQFAIIHRVIEGGKDPAAWVGLRVKVFAFPTSGVSVRETYERSREVMAATLRDHPHIGMCRAGELRRVGGTQQAIDIFERVVQLGLEGIVIVNPDVRYGTKDTVDRHDDLSGTFFKLKQKIVLPGQPFQKTGRTEDVWKDGVKQIEHEFTTTIGTEVVRFTDLQPRETGYSRIKYMEHAPGMGNRFPCESGYRHMHFATPQDMSVRVRVKAVPEKDGTIENLLGWDGQVGRIRSWDRAEDVKTLEGASAAVRLYNPRPFRAADILLQPEPAIVIEEDGDEGTPAQSSRPMRKNHIAMIGRSNASVYKKHTEDASDAPDAGGSCVAKRKADSDDESEARHKNKGQGAEIKQLLSRVLQIFESL